jgi:hypothetical protein
MFLKVCSLIVLCDYMPIFAYKLALTRMIYFLSSPPEFDIFSDEQDVREARARHGLVSVCSEVVEYLGGAVMVRVFFCKFA